MTSKHMERARLLAEAFGGNGYSTNQQIETVSAMLAQWELEDLNELSDKMHELRKGFLKRSDLVAEVRAGGFLRQADYKEIKPFPPPQPPTPSPEDKTP